jgi:hypothetical protein
MKLIFDPKDARHVCRLTSELTGDRGIGA